MRAFAAAAQKKLAAMIVVDENSVIDYATPSRIVSLSSGVTIASAGMGERYAMPPVGPHNGLNVPAQQPLSARDDNINTINNPETPPAPLQVVFSAFFRLRTAIHTDATLASASPFPHSARTGYVCPSH